MHLYAAVVPPAPVLRDLDAAVREAAVPVEELTPTPGAAKLTPIAHFGNLTRGDARSLIDVLARQVAEHACFELSFGGGAALEWPGDVSAWAKYQGDVDRLRFARTGGHLRGAVAPPLRRPPDVPPDAGAGRDHRGDHRALAAAAP